MFDLYAESTSPMVPLDNVAQYRLDMPTTRSCFPSTSISIIGNRMLDRAPIDVDDDLRHYREPKVDAALVPQCVNSLPTEPMIKFRRQDMPSYASEPSERTYVPLMPVGIDTRMSQIPAMSVAGMDSRRLLREAAQMF